MLTSMKRTGVLFIAILSFFGMADSVYLTQHALTQTPLFCNITHLTGCNVVASSPYSQLFGIPLSEFGLLFFAILFVLSVLELVLFDQLLRRALQALSLVGVLTSLYFVSIQAFVIQAFCVYCLASALIAILIFIFASMLEPIRKVTFARVPKPQQSLPPSS